LILEGLDPILDVALDLLARKPVRKLPTADQVAEWVNQAKSLPRMVTY
jgi:hypothetical protein